MAYLFFVRPRASRTRRSIPATGCSRRMHRTPATRAASDFLDGIPIYGRVDHVSKPELRAAIALDRSLMSGAAGKIYLIDVMSPQELHVYHTPRNPRREEYQVYERIAGKWRVQDRVIGGSILFP